MFDLAFVMPTLIQAQGRIPVAPAPVVPIPVVPIPVVPILVVPIPVEPDTCRARYLSSPIPVVPIPVAPMPVGFAWMMLAFYASMRLVLLVIGVLGIWAGIRMLKFPGRKFGIVALSSGLLSIASCYCLPTGIGLFIYGLIVLLNEPVKRAFVMGEQGLTAAEIQNQFARLSGQLVQ